ncbi:MAG: EscU/YscU/HrcU family type III secretion system export apparatus switch protein [Lentilitoribacter sp.]
MSDNSEEKSEQASKRKLKKQRQEGSLPRTSDMATILNVIVALVIFASTGPRMFEHYSEMFDSIFIAMLQPSGTAQSIGLYSLADGIISLTIAIVVGTLAMLLIVTTLYHGGLPFSMKPLTPDFNRLNPSQGFTRIFGRRSWIEAIFHLMRALIWLAISALVIWTIFPSLFHIDLCGPTCGIDLAKVLFIRWFPVTLFILIAYLGFEMIIQKNLYLHEQKMSKSDVKRESKEQTGAPELRRERNRLRTQLAKEAENADKSLANMFFYYGDIVIGIRYHPQDSPLPRVAVKAQGPEAVHLRRYLTEKGLPSLAHEKIAVNCSKVAPGSPVNKQIYEDLAKAMAKMFDIS